MQSLQVPPMAIKLNNFSLQCLPYIRYKLVMVDLDPRLGEKINKMQPTMPNAYTYVKGTNVETHGYAVTQNTFLQELLI